MPGAGMSGTLRTSGRIYYTRAELVCAKAGV